MRVSSALPRWMHFLIVIAGVVALEPLFLTNQKSDARPLYSYTDEKGTPVVTGDYNRIPAQYRNSTSVFENDGPSDQQATRPANTQGLLKRLSRPIETLFGGRIIDVPGTSPDQSKILTYAGTLALLCLIGMNQWKPRDSIPLALVPHHVSNCHAGLAVYLEWRPG